MGCQQGREGKAPAHRGHIAWQHLQSRDPGQGTEWSTRRTVHPAPTLPSHPHCPTPAKEKPAGPTLAVQ